MATMRMGLRSIAFALGLNLVVAAQGMTQVKLDLSPPIINGNQAQLGVTIDFLDGGDPTAGLTFLQLDASASDPTLTSGGSNYSRFSFTPALPVGWDLFADFGPLASESNVSYILTDPNTFPLSALYDGTHMIGTLNVDLTGLPPGSLVTVDVSAFGPGGTTFFYQAPVGDFPSETEVEQFHDDSETSQTFAVTSTTATVPEPATFLLAFLGLAGLAIRFPRGT